MNRVQSEEKKYFTMIPNLIDDMDLDPYAFRLYVHLRRVAGDDGACWQSTNTLARHCKMSTGKVSESKQVLAKAGLIVIENRTDNNKMYHHVTITDIWLKNMQSFTSSPGERHRSQDEQPRSPRETKKNHVKNNEPSQPAAVGADAQPEGHPTSFQGWNEQIRATKNRQAVLVRMHAALYPDAPAPSYSYMAKVAKQVGGASMMAKFLWEFSVRPPVGCILTFISETHKGRKARKNGKATAPMDASVAAVQNIIQQEQAKRGQLDGYT